MDANEAIDILSDCRDSEIGGYCGRSQEVAKFIQSLQAENDRLRKVEEKAKDTKNWLLALCKECRYFGRYDNANVCIQAGQIECNTMEVIKGLEDALKLGTKLGTDLELKGGS